ncbi:MAG: SBBP repeat-containing protein [Promethearchaeota archaeon]
MATSNSIKSEWYRTWGEANTNDYGLSVAVDSLSNVYLTGYNVSSMDADIILVKYDKNGVQQWNRTWGGINGDFSFDIAIDQLDNIYLAGSTVRFGAGNEDMLLLKYDGNGTLLWNATWGGIDFDRCYGCSTDSFENVYLTGVTSSFGLGNNDVVLVKYDKNGEQLWNQTWGGIDYEEGNGIVTDSMGNIYITGQCVEGGDSDMVLIKYNLNGVQQWNRTWGEIKQDIGSDIAMDKSDNIYVVGHTWSLGGGEADIVLVKYDQQGIQQWNRTWGGNDQDFGNGIAVDSSANVYLAGETESFGMGDYDMVLVNYDINGVEHGYYTWGGANYDTALGVAIDSSNAVYLAGYTENFGAGGYDMVLVKYIPYVAPTTIPSYNVFIILVILSIGSFFLVRKIIFRKID